MHAWKRFSPGIRALLASFVLFALVVALLLPRLPARMASHFDSYGVPDGFLSPAANVAILLGACGVLVALFGAMWFGLRRLDPSAMNLPAAPRWDDPAERALLRDRLADSLLWLAAASVAWMAGIFHSLYRANLPGARGLGGEFWLYLLAYVVFMVVWPLLQVAPLFPSDPEEA